MKHMSQNDLAAAIILNIQSCYAKIEQKVVALEVRTTSFKRNREKGEIPQTRDLSDIGELSHSIHHLTRELRINVAILNNYVDESFPEVTKERRKRIKQLKLLFKDEGKNDGKRRN